MNTKLKRFSMHVERDTDIDMWIDNQSKLSASIRLVVSDYIFMHGINDLSKGVVRTPGDSRRVVVNVPMGEERVVNFLTVQSRTSVSVKYLIEDAIKRCGFADYAALPFNERGV